MNIYSFQYRFKDVSQTVFYCDVVEEWAFAYSNIGACTLVGCTGIDFSAFAYSTVSKIVGNQVKYAGEFAFTDCRELKEVCLPSLEKVQTMGFAYCINLEQIHLPSATKLGSEAFRFCAGLRKVVLDKRCEIGKLCFANTPNDLVFEVSEENYNWYKNTTCWRDYACQIVVRK